MVKKEIVILYKKRASIVMNSHLGCKTMGRENSPCTQLLLT